MSVKKNIASSGQVSVGVRKPSFRTTLKRDYKAWLLILPSLVLFAVFSWQPLISGVYLSFFETKGYSAVRFVGLDNYKAVISDAAFLSALGNSFKYTFWSLLIGYFLPIIAAILINEMVHLKPFFRFSVYFPGMVPGMATAIMWKIFFDPNPTGLLNALRTHLGMEPSMWLANPRLTIPLIVFTMTWSGFGSTTILYLANLQGVNQELYEAAEIDGAGLFSRLKNITIPTISNLLYLFLVLQIIGVFQVMEQPLAMTEGGPNNASISLMLQSYFYAFRYFRADRAMAVGTITFLILIGLTVLYFRVNRNSDSD
ncbi:sugar ABC transporter permease [Eubacteriales bacterium mix99]